MPEPRAPLARQDIDAIRERLADGQTPTPPLDEFRAAYAQDDNLWWGIACGHHQNLFEYACEEIDRYRELLREALGYIMPQGGPFSRRITAALSERPK